MIKKHILITAIALGLTSGSIYAIEALGVVNFTTCITDSKYGKNEQSQLEQIKNQYSQVLEETEKELKEIVAKFEDKEYLDGLSPEAEEDLKMKYKALNEDMSKYQNQLYQVLNQANYFFLQKMQGYISKASEQVALKKKLNMVLNKEACFYNQADLDVTKLVISEMDKNFDLDAKQKAESKEKTTQNTNPKTEIKEKEKVAQDIQSKIDVKERAAQNTKTETKEKVAQVPKQIKEQAKNESDQKNKKISENNTEKAKNEKNVSN